MTFGTDEDPVIIFGEAPLCFSIRIKILGAEFQVNHLGLGCVIEEKDVQQFEAFCKRVRYCGYNYETREALISALGMPQLMKASCVMELTASAEKRMRTAVLTALWQKKSIRRSPAIVLTLLSKVHCCDPIQRTMYEKMTCYDRVLKNRPELEGLFERARMHRQRHRLQRGRGRGPVAAITSHCRRLGVEWESARRMIFDELSVDVGGANKVSFKHTVREKLRKSVWCQAARDRAKQGDMEGIQEGINREATLGLYKRGNPRQRGALRKILAGEVWTQQTRAKIPQNREEGSTCKLCGHNDEDAEHLFWFCTEMEWLRDNSLLQGILDAPP